MEKAKLISELKRMRSCVGSWGHIDRKRLYAILKFSGNKVLDVGCSNGSYVKLLCKKGYDAFGCDILTDKAWEGKYRKRFRQADIYNLSYPDESFDTILLFETLEHIEKAESALRELYRVTKKNIILSVPNCNQSPVFQMAGLAFHHWVDRTHVQFFNNKLIKNVLRKNGFRVKYIQYIDSVRPETLVLNMWNIPLPIARIIGLACGIIPIRKKYYMSMLIVATKNEAP